jgi:hypothetical protein
MAIADFRTAESRRRAFWELCVSLFFFVEAAFGIWGLQLDRKTADNRYSDLSKKLDSVNAKYGEAKNDLAEASNALREARATAANASNTVNGLLDRRLSPDQQMQLFSVIALLPRETASFFIDKTVPDSKTLANDIARVFERANWSLGQVDQGIMGDFTEGVHVRGDEFDSVTIKTIADELTALGLDGVAEIRKGGNAEVQAQSRVIEIRIRFKPRQQ